MCGVPHHALDGYVAKLLRLGRKVAICDQVEDPATAKGLVRREITRILTPGTLSETSLLDGKEENFLAALVLRRRRRCRSLPRRLDRAFLRPPFPRRRRGDRRARAWCGRASCCSTPTGCRPRWSPGPSAKARAGRRSRPRLAAPRAAGEKLLRQFGVGHAARLRARGGRAGRRGRGRGARLCAGEPDLRPRPPARARAARSLRPAGGRRDHARQPRGLPGAARRARAAAACSGVVDRTATAAGGRALRDWLRRPLLDPAAIAERQDGVAALLADPPAPGAGARAARTGARFRAPGEPRGGGLPDAARGRGAARRPGRRGAAARRPRRHRRRACSRLRRGIDPVADARRARSRRRSPRRPPPACRTAA